MSTLEAAAFDLPPLPAPRNVPTSWSESIGSWWASTYAFEKESAASEERILRRIPYFIPSNVSVPSPPPPVVVRVSQVPIAKPRNAFLNTVSMIPTSPPAHEPTPTVLLHGYGAGLGFFFPNLPFLAREWCEKKGGRVFAVDWLGMGRSARVPFKIHSKGAKDRVVEAENFFVDSLEEWRKAQNLDKMALVGHSLGAYLSIAYTLRHPDRVSKLILVSPAGIPTSEFAQDVDMPAAEVSIPEPPSLPSSTPSDPKLVSSSKQNGHPNPEKLADAEAGQKRQRFQQQSWQRRMFTYMWEAGWSPFTIMRMSAFYGPLLVSKYSTRRFSNLSGDDVRDMHNYLYHITRARGSGEYCISHILAPGAYARYPMVNRIKDVKVPVVFLYGDHDWMDPKGGEASVEKLKESGNREARMYVVNNAGHHVYLDNDEETNKILLRELQR